MWAKRCGIHIQDIPANEEVARAEAPAEDYWELIARMGFEPDEPQRELLGWAKDDVVLNCTRQWGKSTATAAMAVARGWLEPGMTALVLAPTESQSMNLVAIAREFAERLAYGVKLPRDPRRSCSVVLPNGSRIIGLPEMPKNIRCFTASLLIVDEAAHFKNDEAYQIVRPALVVKNGNTWLLSTSGPRYGFYYKAHVSAGNRWKKQQVKASDCPRLSEEFLAKEREDKTPEKYAQEYECQFGSAENGIFEEPLLEETVTGEGNRPPF